MKFVTFRPDGPQVGRPLYGILLDEYILDLNYAIRASLDAEAAGSDGTYWRKLGQRLIDHSTADSLLGAPASLIELLERGEAALAGVRLIADTVTSEGLDAIAGDGTLTGPLYERNRVRLDAPIPRPGKIIHAANNFTTHFASLRTWKAPEWQEHNWSNFHFDHPTGFLIASSSATGDQSDVIKPAFTDQLDFEVELAAVIGRKAKRVAAEDASKYIVGYTVFNDVSARDMQAREHANRVIMLGKSFDTSAPMGPYLVSADEIDDPMNLDLKMTVNGEVRQQGNTRQMKYSFADLLSWWSNITLEPGDVLTSGSPSGVAAGEATARYLTSGDVMIAEVEQVGRLANTIVDDV